MVAALVTLRFRNELKMTAFATVRLTALMTLCTFLAACSSDAPLSPTPRTDADVAGAWRGTMRITSVTGEQCAAELQFLVGTSSEFRLTLTKTGGSLTGTLDMASGSCELAGGIQGNAVSLMSTACRPPGRTVFFTSCGPDAGRELAIRSMSLQANVAGESASGSHTYVEQINLPLGGTTVGSVTYAGNVAMSRQ